MKRIMAMVTALTLLLTMAAVTPVSAASEVAAAGTDVMVNGTFADGAASWSGVGATTSVVAKDDGSGDNYLALAPGANIEQIYTDLQAGEEYLLEITYRSVNARGGLFQCTVADATWYKHLDKFGPVTGDATIDEAEWGVLKKLIRVTESRTAGIRVTLRAIDDTVHVDTVKLIKLDNVDSTNLIINPGFEFDDAGVYGMSYDAATDAGTTSNILGWEQTNAERTYRAWTTKGDPTGEPYCPPTEENGTNVAYVMGADDTQIIGLKQIVTVDMAAAHYTDFKNYTWNLSFDTYKGVSNPAVTVTVANADGASQTATWTFGNELAWDDENIVAAKMYRNTINLDTLIAGLGGTAVSTVTIELKTNKEAAWDSIKLIPTYVEPVPEHNYCPNPGFENMTDNVLDNWTFVGTIQDESLGTDEEGNNFIGLLENSRADLYLTPEQLPVGAAYTLSFDYMQLGTDGFIKVEDGDTSMALLNAAMGEATGTNEDDMQWQTYTNMFVVPRDNVKGVRILLRNGADEFLCYYDNVRINKIEGYDIDNLITNGDFEAGAAAESTNINGWTQSGLAKSAYENLNGSWTAFVYGKQGEGTSNLSQIVPVSYYDDANGQNYGYTLTWDFGYLDGGRPSFEVVVAFDDGTTVSSPIVVARDGDWEQLEDNTIIVYDLDVNGNKINIGTEEEPVYSYHAYDTTKELIAKLWEWRTLTYDLSHITQSTTSPVKSIQVIFKSGIAGCNVDNVTLKVNKPAISITDVDGIVTSVNDCTNRKFTATADYFGEAEDATLFFALYDVLDDGTLQLADIKMVSGIANAESAELVYDALTLQSGKHAMRAFLIEKSSMKPVAVKVID